MYEYVPKLLKAFINGEKPDFDEQVNTQELIKFAYRQKLLGIFAYMNKRFGLFSGELDAELQKAYYSAVSENTLRIEAFKRLSAVLSENGIEHMPVKGYYLRELYPVKELRSFADIDVLIHGRDREKCDRLMRSSGFSVKNDWEPTYSYLKGNEYYEFHTNLFDVNLDGKANMEEYFSSAWSFAKKREGLCFEPELDFHFIYTVCHTAKHLSGGGAGIRMYLDTALYIKHFDGELSWDYIKSEFERLGLLRFLYVILGACEEWFGVKPSLSYEKPDKMTLSALLSYTLESDIYGKSRDKTLVKLRKEDNPSKLSLFFKILFPPKSELIRRYTFLERSPLLLPLAWIVRVFKNFASIPEKLGSIKSLKHVSKDEADAFDVFMGKIGL